MTRDIDLSRRRALGLIGASLILPGTAQAGGAAQAGGVARLTGTAFGTSWGISAPAGPDVAALADGIDALFARIDRLFSPWRADSALSRFNSAPAGRHAVDPAVIEVASVALDIADKSEGAFDPTVGPLVAQWGFGPIRQAATGGTWREVSADRLGLTKMRSEVTLDLCGIAKGWALDRAAALARAQGVDDVLLDLGGEFRAVGAHPDGRAWRVAIEPTGPTADPPVVLRLTDGAAAATSGTEVQSYDLNGTRYSHIIDPRTRTPTTGGVRSVTVLARDAMTADGWATALCAAGSATGPDLAERHGIAALFVIDAGNGLRQVRTSAIAGSIL